MLKHKGFPGRFPGTDFQFTIRRANPRGITKIIQRERFADRRPADRRADAAFLACLWDYFENEPFERLSWLFGREVLAVDDPFDPESYESLLVIDEDRARASFPDAFDGTYVA